MTQLMKIPIVLWNDQPPSHQITCLTVCKNGVIVSGSIEGQLVTWTVHGDISNLKISAQSMIIAHASSVESIVAVHNTKLEISSGVISLASNQEICLWNAETSCCLTNSYLRGRYHSLRVLPSRYSNSIQECLVACIGYQEYILIIDSFSLSPVFVLKQDLLKCSNCTIRSADITSYCQPNIDEVFMGITYDSTLVKWIIPSTIDVPNHIRPVKIQPKYCTLPSEVTASGIRSISVESNQYDHIALSSINQIFVLKLSNLEVVSKIEMQDEVINNVIFLSNNILSVFLAKKSPVSLILNPSTFQLVKSIPMNIGSHSGLLEQPAIYRRFPFNDIFIISSTSFNSIIMWMISSSEIQNQDSIMYLAESSIEQIWNDIKPMGISTSLAKSLSFEEGCVSCSLQLQEYGFMIFGLKDGSIAIANTLELLTHRMLDPDETNSVSSVILKGHEGRVTCLCHPFEDCTRHNPCHLLSGSIDFSIRLWNIVTGTQLKVYYPHGGFVQDIFVLGSESIDSSNLTVISVASDYSVALINLANEKEVFTTRCHTSPVYAVKWRLKEDLLLVFCTDGNLFIWHIYTGNLERCISGKSAIEIFENCFDDEDSDSDDDQLTSQHSSNVVVNMYQTEQSQKSPRSVLQDIKTKRGFMGSYRQNAHDMSSKKSVFQKVIRRMAIAKRRNRHTLDSSIRKDNVEHVSHVTQNNIAISTTHYSSANNLAQHSVASSHAQSNVESDSTEPLANITTVPPFDIISVRTGHHDSDFHIFLIDVDVLVSQLLNEEEYQYLKENISKSSSLSRSSSRTSTTTLPNIQPPTSSLPNEPSYQGNLALIILTLGLCPTTDSRTYLKYCKSVQNYHSSLLLNTARLLISILHPWGLNQGFDDICRDHLELRPPTHTISFGYMSHNKIQLNMPGWTPSNLFFTPFQSNEHHVNLDHKHVLHWQVSSVMTSQHMVALVILINTFLKLNCFDSDLNEFNVRNSVSSTSSLVVTTRGSISGRQFVTTSVPDLSKKSALTLIDNKVTYWNSLFKYYINISEHMKANQFYQYPLFQELILYWLDYYDEVRRATYTLLMNELNRIQPSSRSKLVTSWTIYLPTAKDIEQTDIENLLILSMDDYIDSGGFYGFWPSNKRYQRTLSVFLISFIASEFSNEFDPLNNPVEGSTPLSVPQMINLAMIMMKIIKMNINLKNFTFYHVKKVFLFLLGRAFQLWRPHLNLSQVISCILDNIAILRYHLQHLEASSKDKSHKYILCNNMIISHRDCLRDILFSHPDVLLHLLNKEMSRYTNSGSQILGVGHVVFVAPYSDVGHFHNPLTSTPNIFNLVRTEIGYLMDIFATKYPDKFSLLILEAVDLLINCSAHRILKKETDILSSFPFLKRFNIIDYCETSHRLVVGTQRGQLAVYDIRNIRCNFVSVFRTPVTCIRFGLDSRHLVAFSYDEMSVSILNVHTNILGMSSQSFRTEHAFPVRTHVQVSIPQRFQIKIRWKTNSTFSILFPDNQELTFAV